MRSVLFATEWLPSYRLELLTELRARLANDGITLNVVHGQPTKAKASSATDSTLPWATYRENKTFHIGGTRITLQRVNDLVRSHDAVVVQQASGLLLNLGLATGLVRPRKGWAMWGHGRHFIPDEVSRWTEALKAWETKRADRFFAYTETSKREAMSIGMPEERITVVNNTFPDSQAGEPSAEIAALAAKIDARSDHVGIMISSLDQWKRLPFLSETLRKIRQEIPDFEFIVIGNGDHASSLHELAHQENWVHMVGAQFAADKARLASICSVTLHPGLVGLHIVDAFRLQCPMVTTTVDYHSHELDYLKPGVNGVMIGPGGTPADMVREAKRILLDDEWRAHLITGGLESAEELSLTASVERFASGIHQMIGTSES